MSWVLCARVGGLVYAHTQEDAHGKGCLYPQSRVTNIWRKLNLVGEKTEF